MLTRLVQREMAKEESGEMWDLDKAEERCAEARTDLMAAARAVPADRPVRDALEALKEVRDQLRAHRRKYDVDEKMLYSSIISNLDKENARLKQVEEDGLLADLPPLERVRIA